MYAWLYRIRTIIFITYKERNERMRKGMERKKKRRIHFCVHHHKWRQWQPENIVFIFSNKSPPFMSFPSRFFFFFSYVFYTTTTPSTIIHLTSKKCFLRSMYEKESTTEVLTYECESLRKKKTRRRRRMTRQTWSRKAKKKEGRKRQATNCYSCIHIKVTFFCPIIIFQWWTVFFMSIRINIF